jgi:hypothetical protein
MGPDQIGVKISSKLRSVLADSTMRLDNLEELRGSGAFFKF